MSGQPGLHPARPPARSVPGGAGGAGSTALVLWLMVLIVFVPIFVAHGLALLLEGDRAAAEPPAADVRPAP